MGDENKDICTIGIMFPVDNDEQAIAYKQKIKAIFEDNPEAVVDFRLSPMRSRIPK